MFNWEKWLKVLRSQKKVEELSSEVHRYAQQSFIRGYNLGSRDLWASWRSNDQMTWRDDYVI